MAIKEAKVIAFITGETCVLCGLTHNKGMVFSNELCGYVHTDCLTSMSHLFEDDNQLGVAMDQLEKEIEGEIQYSGGYQIIEVGTLCC